MQMWMSAHNDLIEKYRNKQPEKFWFRDEEISFFVRSIQDTNTGSRIELTGVGTFTVTPIVLVVYTTTESDIVELNFYSTG
jgi:hypothetical protein